MIFLKQVYYYVRNMQGDIIKILDGNMEEVVEYKYDTWGNVIGMEGSAYGQWVGSLNPFRYRGYYYDDETGMYYLKTRYYNPEWGRFLNADISLLSNLKNNIHNLYAYASNNPVVLTDKEGTNPVYSPGCVIKPDGPFTTVILTDGSRTYSFLNPRPDKSTRVAGNDKNQKANSIVKNQPNLDRKNPSGDYNCYGNAIGKYVDRHPPGYSSGGDVEMLFNGLVNAVGAQNIRRLSSINDFVADDEYMVAMKVGDAGFHFMAREDGVWYNKPGSEGTMVTETAAYVAQDVWYPRAANDSTQVIYSKTYNSNTIYVAIKERWYEN